MGTALLSAYGWFAGLLVVMIVVTALFALILWIAIKPVKKDELDDSSSAKKALGRRETELTIELLNNQHDAKERAELEQELREVKSAEKLVGELLPEDEPKSEKPSKSVKRTAKPHAGEKHAKPAAEKPAKPADERPVKPADEKPAVTENTAENGVENDLEQEAEPKPAHAVKKTAPKNKVQSEDKSE